MLFSNSFVDVHDVAAKAMSIMVGIVRMVLFLKDWTLGILTARIANILTMCKMLTHVYPLQSIKYV